MHLFAVGSVRNHNGVKQGVVYFLLDKRPYTNIHAQVLEPLEIPLCCSIVRLRDVTERTKTCIAVGTTFSFGSEFEPSTGRIVVFGLTTGSSIPTAITVVETNGAVYDICCMNTYRFACAVNHAVHVYGPLTGALNILG